MVFQAIPYTIRPRKHPSTISSQPIPKIIFQTMYTRYLPSNMRNAIRSWIINNPEYRYEFFDDRRIHRFIQTFQDGKYYDFYLRITHGRVRSVFWKYCILYAYGGVYVDIDTVCRKPLSVMINSNCDFISGIDESGEIPNWYLSSPAKHPILLLAIEKMVVSINCNNNSWLNFSRISILKQAILQYTGKSTINPGDFNVDNTNLTIYPLDFIDKLVKANYPGYQDDLQLLELPYGVQTPLILPTIDCILVTKSNGKVWIPKQYYNQFNQSDTTSIQLVTYTDDNYYGLCLVLVQSFLKYHMNPQSIVTVYDIGLDNNQRTHLLGVCKRIKIIDTFRHIRDNNVYLTKAKLIVEAYRTSTRNILIYADSACRFLAPLYRLTNFIRKNHFFAGTTQTPVLEWIRANTLFHQYYQQHSRFNYLVDYQFDPDTNGLTGIEAGFMGFSLDKTAKLPQVMLRLVERLTHTPHYFDEFPHDQRIFAYCLHQAFWSETVLQHSPNISLHDHPNIRLDWIRNHDTIIEKGNLSYRPYHEPIPFFGYCYHNRSNYQNTPDKRRGDSLKDYTHVPVVQDKIILVGDSETNTKIVTLPYPDIWTRSETIYIVDAVPSGFPDQFRLQVNHSKTQLKVTRIDQPTGWGQDLQVSFTLQC
jgi:hypothetical protein